MQQPEKLHFWRRWLATAIDLIASVIIFFACLLFFGALLSIVMFGTIRPNETQWKSLGCVPFQVMLGPMLILLWYYHARHEASAKMATIGKRCAGLVVTDATGARIGIATASGRFLIKLFIFGLSFMVSTGLGFVLNSCPSSSWPAIIPIITFLYIAFFVVPLTRKKRPMQDIASGTFVRLQPTASEPNRA